MRIKPWAIALFVIMSISAVAIAVPADGVKEWTKTCRSAMTMLGKDLKTELKTAMASGGPVEALHVCNVQAVPIAETISAEEGLIVARTSLRARNPKNAPDAWEKKVLTSFEAQKARGVSNASLEAWTIVTDEGGHRTFRYMKAIATASLCLKCHGNELAPDVSAALGELYPDDQAVGYASGDLRGAFTVHMPID